MSTHSRTLLAFITCLLLIAACGQKGPLFLPGRASSFESMTPEQQPAEQEQEAENDEDEEQTDNTN